ncbi:MAG: pyridoxamine 5'-phosphate oxidase family protein [Chthoniobacteraceae bacterium]
MSTILSEEVALLLKDPATIKILSTVDEKGEPHTVVKGSIRLGEDGNLVVAELIESSHTHRNLTRAIWFGGKVAILLQGPGDSAFQIKGAPIKLHVSGPVFLKYYQAIQERLGDVGLAGIWIIRPEKVINQSWKKRLKAENKAHPSFIHLDRLVAEKPEAA